MRANAADSLSGISRSVAGLKIVHAVPESPGPGPVDNDIHFPHRELSERMTMSILEKAPLKRIQLKPFRPKLTDAQKAIEKFRNEGIKTKLFQEIENKITRLIRVLMKLEGGRVAENLTVEFVKSFKVATESKTNMKDTWSDKKAGRRLGDLWLDGPVGLVLKRKGFPIAILGLNLDYDYDAKVPGKFTLNVTQLQGLANYDYSSEEPIKNTLRGNDFARLFLDLAEQICELTDIKRMGIYGFEATPYGYRAWEKMDDEDQIKAIKARLYKRYDQNAQDRKFKLDQESGIYYKCF